MGLHRHESPYQALDLRIPNDFALALTERVCETVDLGGQYQRALAIFVDAADRMEAAQARPVDERRRAREEFVEARRQLAALLEVDVAILNTFKFRTVR